MHGQAGRRTLHDAQLGIGVGTVRIDKHRDDRGLGDHVVQQPQPFALDFLGEQVDSISTKPCFTGSSPVEKTTGIVTPALLATWAPWELVTITDT